MKIIVFSPYYPPHIGGLENYAHELNKNLSLKNVEVTVFAPLLPLDALSEEIMDGVTVYRFPAFELSNYPLPKFWKYQFWGKVIAILRKDSDLLISHTRFFAISTFPAYIFSRLHRKPWIHIEHGADFVQTKSLLVRVVSRMYDHTLGKLTLNKSSRIIAVSENARKFIHAISNNRNVVTITRGFDCEFIQKIEEDKETIKKNDDNLSILFVGRLIEGKGIMDLVNAMKLLQGYPVSCFIIGDGPQRELLEKTIVGLMLGGAVRLLGYRSYEETIALMKAADILVNTSYAEGFSNVIIEAGLCKKAIITTDVGIASEIIINNKNGIIIPTHNPEKLAENIKYFLKNKGLIEKFGKAAFEKVRASFDWRTKIDDFMDIFNV